MEKMRYRVKKWHNLQPGDIVVLYQPCKSTQIWKSMHFITSSMPRLYSTKKDAIEYDVLPTNDSLSVIGRTAYGMASDNVFVLDPAHHCHVVKAC